MSDDKLSQLVQSAIGEAVAHNLGPILKWLYGVFATIIVGTAFVVGMVYDVRASIKTAQDDAAEAKRRSAELSEKVTAHDKSIGILEDRRRGGRVAMGFFAKIFKITKPVNRRRLTGHTVAALLREELTGHLAANYRHLGQKDEAAVTTREKIRQAADRAFMPWSQHRWECEDQARAMVNEAQRMAANEGCSWAIGTLRGRPDGRDVLHVWVWALIEENTSPMFPSAKVVLFDATANEWDDLVDLTDIDYTLT